LLWNRGFTDFEVGDVQMNFKNIVAIFAIASVMFFALVFASGGFETGNATASVGYPVEIPENKELNAAIPKAPPEAQAVPQAQIQPQETNQSEVASSILTNGGAAITNGFVAEILQTDATAYIIYKDRWNVVSVRGNPKDPLYETYGWRCEADRVVFDFVTTPQLTPVSQTPLDINNKPLVCDSSTENVTLESIRAVGAVLREHYSRLRR
jgi:hypothetical protein